MTSTLGPQRWKWKAVSCLVLLLLTLTSTLAQAYTLYPDVFSSASTTFRLDPSVMNTGNWALTVRSAAQDWNNTGLFTYSENSSSPNVISTYFDNSQGALLAYTQPYYLNRYRSYFLMYINTAYPMYDGVPGAPIPAGYFDLRTVVRHELGHALGLGHGASGTLMQQNTPPNQINQIGTDENNGAAYLYNPNYTGPSPQIAGPDGTLGSGGADDTDYIVGYKGAGWTTVSGSGWPRASKRTISYSNSTAATYWLDFTGSRVSRVFTLANNRGSYKIYIDGYLADQQSANIGVTRWQAVKTYSVAYGRHIIEVRTTGSGYLDGDALLVDATFPSPGTVQDTSSNIQYLGTWTAGSFANASGGTLRYSKTTEDAVGTSWIGSSVTYVFTRAPNRGKAMITIDGQNYCPAPQCGSDGYLDLYAAGTSWQSSVTFALPYGYHTVHVGVSGLKSAAATDTYVDFDAFITQ